jgi:EAL domain-containing protein (putative c-di-GMP-specific phosphodiesterase class I)
MTLSVDVSVGIALSSPDGADADTLLQQADIAMYKAKRSHYAFLFYARDPNDDARGRLELMSELRQAIADGEMVPYYQPKVALGTMEIVSVEALVRWVHPSRGVLAPDRFLSLAEQAGLMGPLAMSVLEQAVDQQHAWDCRGIDLSVAVNLSAVNLRDEALPKSIDAILSRRGASAGRVILEITEDCLMVDEEKGRRMLEQLRDLGVELSVDDFGTGYSSLVYLWRLPVVEVKLDRLFLASVHEDPRVISIIRSTVDLAHSLNLRIVAEGVESQYGLKIVSDLGCDIAQGYYLGQPLPAAELFQVAMAGPAGPDTRPELAKVLGVRVPR